MTTIIIIITVLVLIIAAVLYIAGAAGRMADRIEEWNKE